MRSSIGEIKFEHMTIDDRSIDVMVVVHFDPHGNATLNTIEIEDENGKEVKWHSLDFKDREKIESKALMDCIPQDELYDDFKENE